MQAHKICWKFENYLMQEEFLPRMTAPLRFYTNYSSYPFLPRFSLPLVMLSYLLLDWFFCSLVSTVRRPRGRKRTACTFSKCTPSHFWAGGFEFPMACMYSFLFFFFNTSGLKIFRPKFPLLGVDFWIGPAVFLTNGPDTWCVIQDNVTCLSSF